MVGTSKEPEYQFEYGAWRKIRSTGDLRIHLEDLWHNRRLGQVAEQSEEIKSGSQPFLRFDGDYAQAQNYVGFIQSGDELIEIYPKVFSCLDNPGKSLMLSHIFFWLDYCRKWRFPFNRAFVDQSDSENFPELLIYLMANQFNETVSNQPFTQYQQVQERSSVPKGRIDFNGYIARSLVTGNHHILEFAHDPFVFDNTVNRTIKYCCRLLMSQTKQHVTQRILQETIFVLDDVEDCSVSSAEVDRISVNPFFAEYLAALELCQSILAQQIYSTNPYDFSRWCMLLPMEYIFEGFVAGFLEEHFSAHWVVEYQKSDMSLAQNPDAFLMQYDIFLTNKLNINRKIIVDTKYKVRDYSTGDKKKGVSQDDLYQVVSYAMRRGCKEVILLFPNTSLYQRLDDEFEIQSGFDGHEIIMVRAAEIPFWSDSLEDVSPRLIEKLTHLLN